MVAPQVQAAFDTKVRDFVRLWEKLPAPARMRASALMVEAANLLDEAKSSLTEQELGQLQQRVATLFMLAKSYDNSGELLAASADRLCPELSPAVRAWIR